MIEEKLRKILKNKRLNLSIQNSSKPTKYLFLFAESIVPEKFLHIT